MTDYKEVENKEPGKVVISGVYFDDMNHSLHCGGCKWHVSKYVFQEPRSK